MRLQPRSKGAVALITVLIVMAVLLSIGLTIASIGRNAIVLSKTVDDGENAFTIADACVEEGLARLKTDAAYAGGSFSLSGGSCLVTVTSLGGNDRLVRGQGTYGNSIRIIDAAVTLKSNASGDAKKITIDSWAEAN